MSEREPTKICSKCGTEKFITQFYKNPMGVDGRFPWCATCHCAEQRKYREEHPESRKAVEFKSRSKPESKKKLSEKQKAYRKNNPEIVRDSALKYRYGVSLEQFRSMFREQGEKCFLCRSSVTSEKGWHMDHRHGCCPKGKTCDKCLRKVLCARCNLRTGVVENNLINLFSIIPYVCAGTVA